MIEATGQDRARTESSGRDTLAMVAEQVRRRPHAPAVVGGDHDLSYAELAEGWDRAAESLREHDLRPNELVAVRVPPSAAGICAVMGVFRAGGVLLPLDPSQPPLQQDEIIAEAGVRLVVRLGSEAGAVEVIDTGRTPRTLNDVPGAAYLIYTSGSTGTPKGVVCLHEALANVARAQRDVFGVEPGDRVAQIAPWCVDASLFELTLALTAGATLCVAGQADRYPGPPLERFLNAVGATVMVATPSTLRAVQPSKLPSPRLVVSAGEDLAPELARTWAAGRRLVNAYGVTEGSIWTTWAEMSPQELENADFVPLGAAIPGCRLTLRDTALAPVGPGEVGEICLEGAGVAAGYLDRDDLTRERFVDSPSGRLFRTGDLGVHADSGALRFLGRDDEQIKLGGLRVELGEVRHVLRRCPAVHDCAVRPDHSRLVAYVVPEPGEEVSQFSLTEWMERRVPLHMVPSLYVPIEALPLTAWGKLDLAALPAPAAAVAEAQAGTGGEATSSDAEADLVRMVSEILELPRVFPHDDLFMLGMTSLTVARFMNQVLDASGVEIDPVDIFEHPTISELAALIDERRG